MSADLGQDYLALALPTVDRQLAVAGLRLARVLNEIFSTGPKKCDKLSHQALSMSQPLNLGELKRQLTDYKCSGQYDREVADTLFAAQAYVDMRAKEVNHPAVVLDIDETSLSNWPEIIADDFGYIPSGACDLAGPCGDPNRLGAERPGPRHRSDVEAVQRSQGQERQSLFHHRPARYTGAARRDQRNLRARRSSGWEALFMRPPAASASEDPFPNVQAFKTDARRQISKNFTIIVNIGDQRSDLDGGYAERTWKVPNPFYYIP